nr:MAG: capsid protein [Cressdnaviricota sp.]
MSKQYTTEQKLAYYRKKARGVPTRKASKRMYTKKSVKRAAPRKKAYRGRGAYGVSDFMKGASYKNQTLLGTVGAHLGDAVSSIVGLGSYNIKKNCLTLDPMPVKNINDRGGVTVRHREYLGDVITSSTIGAFNINSYSINPGQEGTFPWLSQIAANYEQYEIQGMIFEYRTMSANSLNSTNTALGTVIMATDYNAINPTFAQKSEMENYEYGTSCKPSSSMVHPIECARRQTVLSDLYTRAGAVPAGADVRMYDLGNFQIATTGFQAASVNIGELWVTYQVSFLKAKMYAALGNYNTCAQFTNVCTNVSGTNFWGVTAATPGTIGANTIPIIVSSGASSQGFITFPASQLVQTYFYQLDYIGTSGVTGTISPSYTNCVGGAGGLLFTYGQTPAPTVSSTRVIYQAMIQTQGGGTVPIITLTNSGLAFAGSTSFLTISVVQTPNQYAGTSPFVS